MVAGAYEAMAHFDLFAAHAMIYFTTVSFAEIHQRLVRRDSETAAWSGFLGVGDALLEPLPRESHRRLRRMTHGRGRPGTASQRHTFAQWVAEAIAPRNIGGFGDPAAHHLYPVNVDVLMERHELLGLSRDALLGALPALRGMAPESAPPDDPRVVLPDVSPVG
jgi:hypothetical protein